jgi:hypothetical protein
MSAGARRDLLDLDAGTLAIEITRRSASASATLIIGGSLATTEVTREADRDTTDGPSGMREQQREHRSR